MNAIVVNNQCSRNLISHDGGTWLPSPHSPESQYAGLERCWHNACVKIIKQAVVTASEEEWPALTEWVLYAKFYANLLNGFILTIILCWGLLFSWHKSCKSGKTSLTVLKAKSSDKTPHSLHFSLPLHFPWWSQASWTWFARRRGHVSGRGAPVSVFVCTGEAGQRCRSSCWLGKPKGPPVSVLVLKGTTEPGKGRCRAEHLRCPFFSLIKAARKPFCCLRQLSFLFIKYFLSPYYSSHLKGESFLKGGIWNIKWGIRTLSLLSENSYAGYEYRWNNVGAKDGMLKLGPNGSKEVWQRDSELILAEWMLFSRWSGRNSFSLLVVTLPC